MPSSKYTPQQRKEAEKEVSGDRKVFATGRVTHNGRAYYQEYIEGLDDRSADRLISLGYAVEGKEAQKAAAVAKTSEKEGQKAIPAQPGGASNPDADPLLSGTPGPDPDPAQGGAPKQSTPTKNAPKGKE
jgi:hypothetical protein